MAGSATLGSNLVDSLVPIADSLRDSLHTDFGVRQFKVWTVLREWTSGTIGDGDYTDTETEIEPQPLVEPYNTEFNLEPCGIDEAGYVELREISLTYTEAELMGAVTEGGEQWFIKLTDAHGQEIADSYWLLKERPFPDRIKDIGWKMRLLRADGVS